MLGNTFAKIALTGIDALPLITDTYIQALTFTCICGYEDNAATTETFYICPNCERVFMYTIQFIVYDPKGVD